MAVSSKHVLKQGDNLKTILRVAFSQALPRPRSAPEEHEVRLPPRSLSLIRDYIRHVQGARSDPGVYCLNGQWFLPPHLFPQWSFPVLSKVLRGQPYPMAKVVNGGCKLVVHAPLPATEPLTVRARLVNVDDDGYRAVIEQRVITETESAPSALEATLFAIVPLKRRDGPRKPRPRVPAQARELAYWRLGARAGLDFAKLTGDFNPIHWVPAYARAAGFPGVILHGFSTMARAMEGLRAVGSVRELDVRFTRPLRLPAQVGLYIHNDEIFVGDAPGGPAYLAGRYAARSFDE